MVNNIDRTDNYAFINGEYVKFDLQSEERNIKYDGFEYIGFGFPYYRNGNYVGVTEHIFYNKKKGLLKITHPLQSKINELENRIKILEKTLLEKTL